MLHAANRAETASDNAQSATRCVGLNFTIAVILLVALLLYLLFPAVLTPLTPITATLPWL